MNQNKKLNLREDEYDSSQSHLYERPHSSIQQQNLSTDTLEIKAKEKESVVLVLQYPTTIEFQPRPFQIVYLNQKIDICGVEYFESRFKNWPYFFDLSKDQNIGLMLRHLYLVKNYLEEIDACKGWRVRMKKREQQDGSSQLEVVMRKTKEQDLDQTMDALKEGSYHFMDLTIEVAKSNRPNFLNQEREVLDLTIDDEDEEMLSQISEHRYWSDHIRQLEKGVKFPLAPRRRTSMDRISEEKKAIDSDKESDTTALEADTSMDMIDSLFNKPKFNPRPQMQKLRKGIKPRVSQSKIDIHVDFEDDRFEFSKCRQFIKDNYFVTEVNKIKDTVFPTLSSFNDNFLSKINALGKMTYKLHETPRYIMIKCTKCKRFSYWFCNKDGVSQEDLAQQTTQQLKFTASGEPIIDLKYFRVIVQTHDFKAHEADLIANSKNQGTINSNKS